MFSNESFVLRSLGFCLIQYKVCILGVHGAYECSIQFLTIKRCVFDLIMKFVIYVSFGALITYN